MRNGLTVHVVASDCSMSAFVRVKRYSFLPTSRTLGPDDPVIIYLDVPMPTCDPPALRKLLNDHPVWLPYASHPIPSAWLDPVRWPNVYPVHCECLNRSAGLQPLVTALAQHLAGPSPAEITALVIEKEPRLIELEPWIHATCADPWRVRHPRDLERATGTSLTRIKGALSRTPFRRVEHFLTFVRQVAYEQLVAGRHLPRCLAMQLTGISDRSNFRRQLTQAIRACRAVPAR